eukprot:gene43152-20905_t
MPCTEEEREEEIDAPSEAWLQPLKAIYDEDLQIKEENKKFSIAPR